MKKVIQEATSICRKKTIYLVLILLNSCLLSFPNTPENEKNGRQHINFYGNPREVPAYRLNSPIHLDGVLNEPVWANPGVTGFTQQDPLEGQPATEKTVVWVAYDDEALYVGIRVYDSPDSIIARMGRRDQDLASDFIGIGIDSYHDKQTGFYFWVNPTGSFGEGVITNDSNFDDSWNGVWDYGVKRDSLGWSVEMKIPFSQLRFSRADEYVWGFNVIRFIQRKQETSFLRLIPKDSNKNVSLYPHLVGIKHIKPPRRLEVLPYLVSSAQFLDYPSDDPFGRNRRLLGNVGADVKIGIGSNLTMDVTLNPDFGQVELDPAVVNLTAFETFFREKRPFFIEGAGIFSFGNRGATNDWTFNYNPPTFFYSRRIGRPPQLEPLHSGEINSPANSTILSAVKISGKTYSDWEIGVLQAFTAREYAEIDSEGVRLKEEVEPFTSYTVVRTFKHFMTNRAGLGLIGTSTIRDLRNRNEIESLRDKAYVFGLDGYWFLGKQRRWVINGWWGASHVTGSKEAITELQQNSQHYFQRPDFEYTSLDSNKTELNGWTGRLALNKEQGNFYLNAAIAVNSPGFESNDLGFHSRGNVINQHLVLGYRWFQPGKIFRNAAWHVSNFRTFDFDGNKTAEGFMSFFHGRLLNYTGIFGRAGYFRRTLDISRTRGGPAMEKPAGFFSGISISSDSRKDFILELKGNYGASARGGWRYGFGSEMEWKPGSRFFLEVEPEYFRDYSPAQYIDTIDDPAAQHTYGKRYIFGILDQKQLSASVRVNYTFTPQLSLQGFFQPLISSGKYTDIKELAHPGGYDFIHYGKDQGSSIKLRDDEYEIDPDGTGQHLFYISQPDFNFKSLRGTVVLRWEFAPGSTLFFVWTHDRAEDENSGEFRFGRDLRRLLDQKADNIFLVKFSYWWNP